MSTTTQTHATRILSHLKQGQSITALEALNKFGCMNLKGRIHELRQDNNILTEFVKSGDKRYARYFMADVPREPKPRKHIPSWKDYHEALTGMGFDLTREFNREGDLEDEYYHMAVADTFMRITLRCPFEVEIHNFDSNRVSVNAKTLFALNDVIRFCKNV